VVVVEKELCDGVDSSCAKLLDETLGAGDSAEGSWSRRSALQTQPTVYAPDYLLFGQRKFLFGFIGQDNCIGPGEGTPRFAQTADGEKFVVRILGGNEDDIEVAVEGPMLEAIVKKMELGAEVFFCELSCCRAAFADDPVSTDVIARRGNQRADAVLAWHHNEYDVKIPD